MEAAAALGIVKEQLARWSVHARTPFDMLL